jgi:hypothetical protein
VAKTPVSKTLLGAEDYAREALLQHETLTRAFYESSLWTDKARRALAADMVTSLAFDVSLAAQFLALDEARVAQEKDTVIHIRTSCARDKGVPDVQQEGAADAAPIRDDTTTTGPSAYERGYQQGYQDGKETASATQQIPATATEAAILPTATLAGTNKQGEAVEDSSADIIRQLQAQLDAALAGKERAENEKDEAKEETARLRAKIQKARETIRAPPPPPAPTPPVVLPETAGKAALPFSAADLFKAGLALRSAKPVAPVEADASGGFKVTAEQLGSVILNSVGDRHQGPAPELKESEGQTKLREMRERRTARPGPSTTTRSSSTTTNPRAALAGRRVVTTPATTTTDGPALLRNWRQGLRQTGKDVGRP